MPEPPLTLSLRLRSRCETLPRSILPVPEEKQVDWQKMERMLSFTLV